MTATIALVCLPAIFAAVIYAIRSGYDVKAALKLVFIALTFEATDSRRDRGPKSLHRDHTADSPAASDQPIGKM
jgi:hypothetical protein